MGKIGLFYGTQTGKTETVAEAIQEEFGKDLEDNQPDLTESRVKSWVTQVSKELQL